VPKNEDGEFELILGNRQLLGVFFIVIVLLAVFFTMGYIVGRNSAPLISADVNARKATEAKPLVVDSPAPKEPAPAPAPQPAPAPVEPAPKAETPTPTPAPAPVTKNEKPPEKEKPAKTKKEEAAKAKTDKPRPTEASSNLPEQGKTYLQLVATTKTDADRLVELLRKNGFKALDYQIPDDPNRYRVMVGPIPDGGVNKMRADLTAKSFPGEHAIVKKSF
jgi:cytoskeletal protein RodZ